MIMEMVIVQIIGFQDLPDNVSHSFQASRIVCSLPACQPLFFSSEACNKLTISQFTKQMAKITETDFCMVWLKL